MQLIPAIDLRDGRCVRLLRGDFRATTVYADEPVTLARQYAKLGADMLHVVDLDGAQQGCMVNRDTIVALVEAMGGRVQFGGGLRDEAAVESALALGVARVVIGSLAVRDRAATTRLLRRFGPDRIVLALDVSLAHDQAPRVMTHGWTEDSGMSLADVIGQYQDAGSLRVLCTDIGRDGAMSGPNTRLYRRCVLQFPGIRFQASGGIRNAADLELLSQSGVESAICGKALLEKRLTAEEIEPFLRSA